MKWVLVDVVLVLLALAFLAVLALGLWRKVKLLSKTVATAGEAVGRATEALAVVQADGPLGGPGQPGAPVRPPGVQR